MPRRAALYARYSTDLQSDRSVEDQLALCEGYALAQGLTVAARFHDRARSGATMQGRDGLAALMAAARAGAFEVVVVEALDRLSRDQEDLAGLHKRLTFAGIDILAVHDGRADALQVGIRGLVSSLWLTDLKHKIRRGMGGVIRDGRHAGGRAYGYRPTPGAPGHMTIHEEEAAVVRRVFAEYLAGRSPRDIAGGLNRDGILPPRGTAWNASTINGNATRGHGILQNPLYAGRLIWNRVRMVRDPETGKRVSRPNPRAEWQEAAAPDLALIDPETWARAQERKAGRAGAPRQIERRRTSILSGLVRCPRCLGGMYMHDRAGKAVRIKCSTQRESGSCTNTRSYRMDRIEAAVLSGIRRALNRPEGIEAWLAAWQADLRVEGEARRKVERALAEARARLDRLSRHLIEGRVDEAFFDREAPPIKAEIAGHEERLAATPAPDVVTLHPAAVRQYAHALSVLSEVAERSAGPDAAKASPEMVEMFRALIARVVLIEGPGDAYSVEVIGPLTPLLRRERVAPAPFRGAEAVAEERYLCSPPMSWGRWRVQKIAEICGSGLAPWE